MDKDTLKIISTHKTPTPQARALEEALKKQGIKVILEFDDGFKTIDLRIPKARLDIEVDGIQHLIDPNQIVADLYRGHYSHKDGYDTIHIPNKMIKSHLKEISEALAEAVKIKERNIRIHLD